MIDWELYKLIPILEALAKTDDVRPFLQQIVHDDWVLFAKAAAILN